MSATFGDDIRKEFFLDPDHIYLNHGSYGVVSKQVFDARLRLMTDIQTFPDRWFRHDWENLWSDNVKAAAKFLHADPDNLVFVQNATTGINSVLKSLGLHPGDAILMHSWQYNAIMMTGEMTSRLTGCEVVVAKIKLPINDRQEIIDLYQEMLEKHRNIKVVVLELICSPTAVLFPIKELAAMCKKYGATVVIDGAHGPGQVPLHLKELESSGVDCFVGTFHKWLFAPLGCAILWIHPRLHATVRPAVTSHTLDSEKPGPCFSFQGARDDTPFYTAKSAIDFYEEMGGMEAIVQYNKDLIEKAVAMLLEEWNTCKFPVPPDMEAPCMRLVKMPHVRSVAAQSTNKVFGDASAWMKTLEYRFHMTTVIIVVHGETYLRLSCNIYNTLEDYKKLVEAVKTLVEEDETQEFESR